MRLKYKIDELSYLSCKKCSKELLKRLSLVDEVENVSINYNDETIEVESVDSITKDKIDEIVRVLEEVSYCKKHSKNKNIENTYHYEDKCGEFDENILKEKLDSDTRFQNVVIDRTSKTITISHKSNINSYIIIEKIVKNIDDDVVIEREIEHIKKIRNYSRIFSITAYVLSLILLTLGIIFKFVKPNLVLEIVFFSLSYLFIGHKVFISCIDEFKEGNIFNEELLMIIASIGALIIKEEIEAIALVVLYSIGELIEDRITDKTLDSIKDMMNLSVDEVMLEDGRIIETKDAKVDDIIIVKPGELIPLDGIVVDGISNIDTKKMTGEPLPQYASPSSNVISGTLNQTGLLKIRVVNEKKDSQSTKLLELINEANSKKSKAEKFIDKFSKLYTPIIILTALVLFLVQFLVLKYSLTTALNNMFVVLVISCPCAIVISIPLAYSASLGRASKSSIMVKSSAYIEEMSKLKSIVFDKTGTLTEGNFSVKNVETYNNFDKLEAIKIIATLESYSNHPIAKILYEYGKEYINSTEVSNYNEYPGLGIEAVYNGLNCKVGSYKFLKEYIDSKDLNTDNTTVYLVINNKLISCVILSDSLRESSKNTINHFKLNGIKTYLLTGDSKDSAAQVSNELSIDDYKYNLLPSDKLDYLTEYINDKSNRNLAYIGDGFNDTPCLKLSDIGIAMGLDSADAAKEASDVVILSNDISKVKELYLISKKTHLIALFNLVFAILIKAAAIVIASLGILSSLNGLLMLISIFADVGVALICILNSCRVLNYKIK